MKKYILALLVGMSFISAQTYVDALRLSNSTYSTSPRTLGMSNTFVAVSNDYYGSFFNPAGLGLMKYSQFVYDVNIDGNQNNTNFFNVRRNTFKKEFHSGNIGFAIPLPVRRGSMVVSFGYNTNTIFNNKFSFNGFNAGQNSYVQYLVSNNDKLAYDLGLSYPIYDSQNKITGYGSIFNGRLQQSGTIEESGKISKYQFSASVQVMPNIYVGGTLNIYSGNFKREKNYTEEDVMDVYPLGTLTDPAVPETNNFKYYTINDVLDWDLKGVDLKIGAIIKIKNNFNFGVTINLPTSFLIKETYLLNGSSFFENNQGYNLNPQSYYTEYKISTPYKIAFGGASHFRNLTLTGQIEYIDYREMEFTSGLSTNERLKNNQDIDDLFREVLNFRFGAEFHPFRSGIILRAGLAYEPSPYLDDDPKYDKKFVSVGVGLVSSRNFTLDIGYMIGWWDDFVDNYDINYSRVYQKVSKHKLALGLKYNF